MILSSRVEPPFLFHDIKIFQMLHNGAMKLDIYYSGSPVLYGQKFEKWLIEKHLQIMAYIRFCFVLTSESKTTLTKILNSDKENIFDSTCEPLYLGLSEENNVIWGLVSKLRSENGNYINLKNKVWYLSTSVLTQNPTVFETANDVLFYWKIEKKRSDLCTLV